MIFAKKILILVKNIIKLCQIGVFRKILEFWFFLLQFLCRTWLPNKPDETIDSKCVKLLTQGSIDKFNGFCFIETIESDLILTKVICHQKLNSFNAELFHHQFLCNINKCICGILVFLEFRKKFSDFKENFQFLIIKIYNFCPKLPE